MRILGLLGFLMTCICPLYVISQLISEIVGHKSKTVTYPKAEEREMAVVICCFNEERVIGRTLAALKKQTYSRHRVFVVAHNCTDKTKEIAQSFGAEVILLDDPNARRKADALNAASKYIAKKYRERFEYVTYFDADSVPSEDYLSRINDAMAVGCDCASGRYDFLNYNDGLVARLCSGLYMLLSKTESLAANNRGLPVNLYGSGFCVRWELVRDGWNTVSLSEDFEFVVKEVLENRQFIFVPDAVFKAEMPTGLGAALRQRRRWAIGQAQCFRLYCVSYLKRMKSPNRCLLKQFKELCIYPISLVITCGAVTVFLSALFSREFVWAIMLVVQTVFWYLLELIIVMDAFRFAGYKWRNNVTTIMIEPIWAMLTVLLEVVALFVRDDEWRPTEHTGSADEKK